MELDSRRLHHNFFNDPASVGTRIAETRVGGDRADINEVAVRRTGRLRMP